MFTPKSAKVQVINIEPIKELTNLEYLCLIFNKINYISPISNLTNLECIYLDFNFINDIIPLQYLENCDIFVLSHNQIEDILLLVKNKGLHGVKSVGLWDKHLNKISINIYIPILRNRGVIVLWS